MPNLATGESTSATAPTAQHPSPIASISTGDAMSTTAPALSPDIARAVVRFETALVRFAELSMLDASDMTGAQFDSLALAQDTMAESQRLLEQAGQLRLIRDAA